MTQKRYSPGVMIYGGPPMMIEDPPPPNLPTITDRTTIQFPNIRITPSLVSDEDSKSRIRVSARLEKDGTLKLKIHIDGKFHSELESEGTTITTEFEVGKDNG